jgi:hypothetical protein
LGCEQEHNLSQIDFVTEAGFPEYLALIEKQFAGVNAVDWPLPQPPKLEVPVE